MAKDHSIRVAALVARAAGLETVRGLSGPPWHIEFVGLFTHRRLPASEDPGRGERPEYRDYVELAHNLGVAVHAVDSREEAARLTGLEECRPFDVLLSVNWRYFVPQKYLAWARMAPVNLHRGRLPDYAGAEPVRRGLEAGEQTITLTAHVMTAECDVGTVLVEHEHAVGALRGPTLADDVERIKRELASVYPRVALRAIERARAGLRVGA